MTCLSISTCLDVTTPRRHAPSLFMILLVDDNRDGNIVRRSVLEELGYEVLLAGCGGEALKLFGEHSVDSL